MLARWRYQSNFALSTGLTHIMTLVYVPSIMRLAQVNYILLIGAPKEVQLHSLVPTVLAQSILIEAWSI